MAENDVNQQQTEPTEEQAHAETDWKAEARKWEQRAKANRAEADSFKAKAEKWDAHELEDMTEAEKATKRAEQAEAQLAQLLAERQHATDASEVAKESGVPVELLQFMGTREDMEAFAEKYTDAAKVPAAASAPQSRIVRPDGAKPTNAEIFAQSVGHLFR